METSLKRQQRELAVLAELFASGSIKIFRLSREKYAAPDVTPQIRSLSSLMPPHDGGAAGLPGISVFCDGPSV